MLRASGRIGHGFGLWLGSLAMLSFLGAVDRARAANKELSEIFIEVRPSAIETRTAATVRSRSSRFWSWPWTRIWT